MRASDSSGRQTAKAQEEFNLTQLSQTDTLAK